jgi:hypothetical protein
MPKTTSAALSKDSHKKRTSKSSKASKSKKANALATCPVNGAGWCPYPFSVEQLERRIKARAEAEKLKNESSK